MKIQNENGLSLVEVLAVLVIGSIVMIFMYNLIANGMKTSNQIKERASMQNEANYMLTVLREFHERGNPYLIKFIDTEMIVCEQDLTAVTDDTCGSDITIFNKFEYSPPTDDIDDYPLSVSPKNGYKYEIKINISNDNLTYPTVKIALHRL